MKARMERIAIIGAGPCGIAAGKNLLDEGFHNITIYEQKDVIGGNWVFSKECNRHASVYETTHLVSSATLSQYLDYPFPEGTPDFPGHAAMRNYFEGYARRFGVDHFIEFQTRVEHVQRKTTVHGWSRSIKTAPRILPSSIF